MEQRGARSADSGMGQLPELDYSHQACQNLGHVANGQPVPEREVIGERRVLMSGSPCIDGDSVAARGCLKELGRRREGVEFLPGLSCGPLQFSLGRAGSGSRACLAFEVHVGNFR